MENFGSRRSQRQEYPNRTAEVPEAVRTQWNHEFEKEIDMLAQPNMLVQEEPFLRQECFSLNNCEVVFCGVQHQSETLTKFREQLQLAMTDADLVVLEGSPEIQLGKRGMRRTLIEDYQIKAESLPSSAVEIHAEFASRQEGDFECFYQGLTDMAAERERTVVLVDPANLAGATLQERSGVRKYWESELPAEIKGGSKVVMGAGAIAGAAAIMMQQNPVMSRRGLLRGAGYVAAGLAPGALGIASQKSSADLNRDPNAGGAPINDMSAERRIAEETVAYSMVDLRNIVIAEKLEALSKVMPKGTKIMIVYGDGHRKALQDYLLHPELRLAKKQVYRITPSAINSDTAIGAWSFNYAQGAWVNDTKETEVLTRFLKTS